MADKKISALTAATTPLAGTEVLPIVQSGITKQVSVANLTVGRDVANKTSSVQSGTVGGAFLNFSDTGFAASRYWKGQNDVSAYGDYGLYQSTDNTGASYTARLYFDAAGNPTVSTGNLVIGTAGKGIDFSANPSAPGMTSELLDWYEEGTFTATRSGFVEITGGGAITSLGTYTRIGRLVLVNIRILPTGGATTAALAGIGSYLGGLPYTPAQQSTGVWVNTGSVAASGSVWVNTDGNLYLTEGWGTSASAFVFSATYTV